VVDSFNECVKCKGHPSKKNVACHGSFQSLSILSLQKPFEIRGIPGAGAKPLSSDIYVPCLRHCREAAAKLQTGQTKSRFSCKNSSPCHVHQYCAHIEIIKVNSQNAQHLGKQLLTSCSSSLRWQRGAPNYSCR
jgi:hypothetical protein